jgi:Tol biopolymer transport system component
MTDRFWVASAYSSTFSPDGRQLAYGWRSFAPGAPVINDLRTISVDGSGVQSVYQHADIDFFHPTDWSRDGKTLALLVSRTDRTTQIATFSIADRAFRPLKTAGWRGPGKIFFSPDGKFLAYDLPAGDDVHQRDVFVMATDGTSDRKVVDQEANDVLMGWSPDGSRLFYASDYAGAVGLWAQPVANGRASGRATLLTPDIGSVSSLGLTDAGTLHIVKDTSTQSVQIAPIDLEAGKLSGPAVHENFRAGTPAWSPGGRLLAYMSKGLNGNALAVRSVETGRLRELRPALEYFPMPQWLDEQTLVTGARDLKGRNGIFRIDVQTGQASLVTDAAGFGIQVSPDGKKIYHVAPQSAAYVERDLAAGTSRELFRLPPNRGDLQLSPDGQFVVTVISDTAAKASRVLLMPVAGGEPRELYRVGRPDTVWNFRTTNWTPDSRAVLVVKTNGREAERKELWLIPVSGAGARKLDINLDNWDVGQGVRLHPNGKQIAFFTGRASTEVWVLENLLSASTR